MWDRWVDVPVKQRPQGTQPQSIDTSKMSWVGYTDIQHLQVNVWRRIHCKQQLEFRGFRGAGSIGRTPACEKPPSLNPERISMDTASIAE
jgi:hypothetical protein